MCTLIYFSMSPLYNILKAHVHEYPYLEREINIKLRHLSTVSVNRLIFTLANVAMSVLFYCPHSK